MDFSFGTSKLFSTILEICQVLNVSKEIVLEIFNTCVVILPFYLSVVNI